MQLNIYGEFAPGPWKSPAEIIAAINSGKDEWFPGKVELRQFAASGAGLVEGAVNVWNVLCSIARHKPTRINVFTHATAGYIGLSGRVVKGDVIFNAGEATALTPDIIERAEEEKFTFSDSRTKNITINSVHAALGKNAEMVVYACHSGLDQAYLKRIASLLRIKVSGFKTEIHYYPEWAGKTLTWQYSAGTSRKVRDFHGLVPDVFATP
jgi:hypothetical protein